MAQDQTKSTRVPISYRSFINQFLPDTIKSIQQLERTYTKMCRQKMSILFNEKYIYKKEIDTRASQKFYNILVKWGTIWQLQYQNIAKHLTHYIIPTHTSKHKELYIYISTHTHTRKHKEFYIFIYVVCRVFVKGLRDQGSAPGRVIPKTQKMILDASLLNTQHYKVWIKSKDKPSKERSSTLPYTLV